MQETNYLKDNIENIQKLMRIPALSNFELDNLSSLLRLSKLRKYKDGETIILEGDSDPWLYFLLSGEVKIVKNNYEISKISKMGEIFGEMRLIDKRDRSASVVSSGGATCLAVNTGAGERLMSQDSREDRLDFLLLLYRIFAEYLSARLRLANDELVIAKKEAKYYKARCNRE
ncbi:MAG: Crp/Fnr family transcriptional regulator [Deltaproteobacteria bacterium]|nr:MAG: Crp/Fnr family transcriptional regulator [Deltaproteobacteria bacterium]